MEKSSLPHKPDTLISEHLSNGEKPIAASVEGYADIPINGLEGSNYERIEEAAENDDVERVDHVGDTAYQKTHGFLTGGSAKYAISPISEKEKVSKDFLMCTGIVAVGKDKETGKNISFLSHQYPQIFLPGKRLHERFTEDLKTRLAELKERSVPGSVDVVIAGGEYYKDLPEYVDEYAESVRILKEAVSDTFGFDPVAITGPKFPLSETPSSESILFDTENRRLYISRPKSGDTSSESFRSKDAKTQEEKWRREYYLNPEEREDPTT